jgi:hypothetical protein
MLKESSVRDPSTASIAVRIAAAGGNSEAGLGTHETLDKA